MVKQKTTAGTVAQKISLQRNYTTMQEKNKWVVRCFLKDGTEVDPAEVTIPKGHPVYHTLRMIEQNRLRG
ncbi:TPA: hypothetical protein U1C81_000694 [Streptococcus suis]|nr:hypothetical protein [Streptococcus suis]